MRRNIKIHKCISCNQYIVSYRYFTDYHGIWPNPYIIADSGNASFCTSGCSPDCNACENVAIRTYFNFGSHDKATEVNKVEPGAYFYIVWNLKGILTRNTI